MKEDLKDHWMKEIFICEIMVETTEFYRSQQILDYMSIVSDKYSFVLFNFSFCFFVLIFKNNCFFFQTQQTL